MPLIYKTPWCAKCKDAPRAKSHAYCQSCRNSYQNEYRRRRYASEPDYRRAAQQRDRLTRYGLTEDEYTFMWAAQGGVCAICLCDVEGRELSVDHNHETGEIRALLCANCNGALGMLKEKPYIINRVAEYAAIFDN